MTLSDVSIQRPILTWMMTLALVVFGLLGYQRLGVDQFLAVAFLDVFLELAFGEPGHPVRFGRGGGDDHGKALLGRLAGDQEYCATRSDFSACFGEPAS